MNCKVIIHSCLNRNACITAIITFKCKSAGNSINSGSWVQADKNSTKTSNEEYMYSQKCSSKRKHQHGINAGQSCTSIKACNTLVKFARCDSVRNPSIPTLKR